MVHLLGTDKPCSCYLYINDKYKAHLSSIIWSAGLTCSEQMNPTSAFFVGLFVLHEI